MAFQTTVVALLALLVFTVTIFGMRAQDRAQTQEAIALHSAIQVESCPQLEAVTPDVRVVRISKDVLSEPEQAAKSLGLKNRRLLPRLLELESDDVSHLVLRTHEGGRPIQLVVLAE